MVALPLSYQVRPIGREQPHAAGITQRVELVLPPVIVARAAPGVIPVEGAPGVEIDPASVLEARVKDVVAVV